MKLYDSLVAAAIGPYRYDVVHNLHGQAGQFRNEDRGEARAMGFFVLDVAAGSGDLVNVRSTCPIELRWNSSTGTDEHSENAVPILNGSLAVERSESRV